MPRQPLSLEQKAKAKSDANEKNMSNAILAYRSLECRADGKRKTLCDLAKEHNVSPSALCRRVKAGAIGIAEFNKTKQTLSEGTELELESWALDLANRNLPLTNSLLADKALRILQARDPAAKPVGNHWVNRFLIRHGDKLRRHWSRPLDNIRSTSATQEAVDSYFKQYISLVGEDGSKIAPELQYAFDETGIQPSLFHSKRVIGSAQSSSAPTATATDRELTTYLPVISASGTLVMGLVIFKSKYLRQSFLGTKGNPHDLMYVLLLAITLILMWHTGLHVQRRGIPTRSSEHSLLPNWMRKPRNWQMDALVSSMWMATILISLATSWTMQLPVTSKSLGILHI
jgi:hypothetical protein